MNAEEEFNRIKNLYKKSNKYLLKLSYNDIGILIRMVDALDKRAKMNKVECSSLYGIQRNKNQFENVIKILEKEQEKNLDIVGEIIKAKDLLNIF